MDLASVSGIIANLERSQVEYNAGQTEFKSILVYPKTKLESGYVYISLYFHSITMHL